MTTVESYPLERRKIVKKTVVFTIFLYVILVPITLVILIFNIFTTLVLVMVALIVALPIIWWIYQREYYKKYFYDIRPDFLTIKKGVFTPKETVLPYDKLQDVYVDQDIFDRMFKLYDVHVSTATTASAWNAHIDGLNSQNSEALREQILGNIRANHQK